MKKKLCILLLTVVIVFTCLSLSSCDDKGEAWLEKVDVSARIFEDGSMTVQETWVSKYDSSDPKQNLYKTINTRDPSFPGIDVGIKNLDVYDVENQVSLPLDPELQNLEYLLADGHILPSNLRNKCYIDKLNSSSYEIGLTMDPISKGTRTFVFTYTLTNMVAVYEDTAVLYWQAFSKDFSLYIENYQCNVFLPGDGKTDSAKAYFHCENETSLCKIENDRLVYTVSEADAGTMIETRVLTKPSLFSGCAKVSTEKAAYNILKEEADWYNEWQATLKKRRILAIVDVIFACIIPLLSAATVVLLILKNKTKKGAFPQYYREIPEGWSAGELGYVHYYYAKLSDKEKRNRLLSATILELARRDFIELIPDNDKDYLIGINSVPEPKLNDLKPHERCLLNLLSRVQAYFSNQPFSMDDFEEYAKKQYSDVDKSLHSFDATSKDRFFTSNLVSVKGKLLARLPVAFFISIGLGIFSFVALNEFILFTPISLLVCGILALIFVPKKAKLNTAGDELYGESQGLKNYMLDFSNLKEYEIPQLILWEEYLVFATMMNISKEVVKSLKLVYPQLTDENLNYSSYRSSSCGYFYTYIWLSSPSRGFGRGIDLGSRFNNAFSSIANTSYTLAHPPKSSGGGGGFGRGGGGFGGGGGGFGGGGGGAR